MRATCVHAWSYTLEPNNLAGMELRKCYDFDCDLRLDSRSRVRTNMIELFVRVPGT